MNIEQIMISETNKKYRPGIKMKPRYITVHETGTTAKNADAFGHARVQAKENSNLGSSWHYTVDDSDIIYQSIPDNEVSWQVKEINSPCNMSSIGISICVNAGAVFRRARYNTIQLIIFLMKKYSIPLGGVYPRNKWDKSSSPEKILTLGWHHFIGELKYELDQLKV